MTTGRKGEEKKKYFTRKYIQVAINTEKKYRTVDSDKVYHKRQEIQLKLH